MKSLFHKVLGRFHRSRAMLAALMLVVFTAPAWATATEALPTGLTPTDMVTAATGEISGWLTTGIPIIIGFTLLAAFVRGMTRKGTRPVK